ncbi:hypothetical protein F5879DRAFT_985262 [Lentinula edodes]|nr:hypothetical protein F5879DRAFT_985262 [Lentinula edodes]KAJ3911213.1 hypothetical protein F5877DRAFT_86300 [Lentinula edodes]
MVNQRIYVEPTTRNTTLRLRSRFYSGHTHTARTFDVITAAGGSSKRKGRHPLVDFYFESHKFQPHTHDVLVNLKVPGKSKSSFRVFFKRSMRLPVNPVLGVQGDLVVMRAAAKCSDYVVNMRGRADYRLADYIVQRIAPVVARFQQYKRRSNRAPKTINLIKMGRYTRSHILF